jgi:hypothetical protein
MDNVIVDLDPLLLGREAGGHQYKRRHGQNKYPGQSAGLLNQVAGWK